MCYRDPAVPWILLTYEGVTRYLVFIYSLKKKYTVKTHTGWNLEWNSQLSVIITLDKLDFIALMSSPSPPYRSVSDEIEIIIMKTSFKPRVSRMGLGSFRNINIFEIKYFFSVCLYSPFFSNLLNQNLHKC